MLMTSMIAACLVLPASAAAPSPPQDFFGLATADGYRLSWHDPVADEDWYVLERITGTGAAEQVSIIDRSASSYTDPDFSETDPPAYRLCSVGAGVTGGCVTCDASLPTWTYIRIIGYDALWGQDEPTRSDVLSHLSSMSRSRRDNLNLVLLGDWYGDEGSLWGNITSFSYETIDQDELNMGDPQTYRDFFDWVVANHPGQRYAVSYWSHGSGAIAKSAGATAAAKAIGFDSTDEDQLDPDETAEVMRYLAEATGRPVEVFFACTCLTGMVENAYALRDSVRYLVAGESVVGCGCDVLEVLDDALDRSARWLANRNVACQPTSYYQKDIVYAATDLGQMESLATMLDELAWLLMKQTAAEPGFLAELRTITEDTEDMGFTENPVYCDAYLDLVDLCTRLSTVTDPAVAARAEQIRDFVEQQVITSFVIQNDDQGLYSNAHGLSIYHPTDEFPTYYGSYGSLSFARDTRWDEYLRQINTASYRRPAGRRSQ
jgi:hypothetical protein